MTNQEQDQAWLKKHARAEKSARDKFVQLSGVSYAALRRDIRRELCEELQVEARVLFPEE